MDWLVENVYDLEILILVNSGDGKWWTFVVQCYSHLKDKCSI